MKFRLIETYLFEDLAAVRRQYPHIPEVDFDQIIRLDPTFDENRDSVGKYGKWLLGLYKKSNPLNVSKAFTLLQTYNDLKNDKSKKIEKDINKFKSFDELSNAIDSVETVELSDRQKLRQRQANKDYDLVWQNDYYAIFVPNSWEADVNLGKGTTWCTADSREKYGKAAYERYLKEGGKYYIIISKQDKTEKYQFHFESAQFKDKADRSIDLLDFVNKKSTTSGMLDFFKQSGYDINKDFVPDKGWDEVIDGIFSNPGEEIVIPVNSSSFTAERLVDIDETWQDIFTLIDTLNSGYLNLDLFRSNIPEIINELKTLFKGQGLQFPEDLENDREASWYFLQDYVHIIENFIVDYTLEELLGTTHLHRYFKIEDNNLYMIMNRADCKNNLRAYYRRNSIYPIQFLRTTEDIETVIDSLIWQVDHIPNVSNKEAIMFESLEYFDLSCELDSRDISSNLIQTITADYTDTIIDEVKNLFREYW